MERSPSIAHNAHNNLTKIGRHTVNAAISMRRTAPRHAICTVYSRVVHTGQWYRVRVRGA